MRPSLRNSLAFVLWSASVPLLMSACSANQQILDSGKPSPTPVGAQTPATTIEQEIDNMRTADFRYIWVIRRSDGGVLDQNDKAILRANTVEMNRRVLADDDKAIILGSNNVPFKENFDALTKTFSVQDVSPESVPSPLPTREPTPKAPKIKQ